MHTVTMLTCLWEAITVHHLSLACWHANIWKLILNVKYSWGWWLFFAHFFLMNKIMGQIKIFSWWGCYMKSQGKVIIRCVQSFMTIHPIIETFHLKHKFQCHGWARGSQDFIKVSVVHPLGTVNISTKLHGNPIVFKRIQSKVVGQQTDRLTYWKYHP